MSSPDRELIARLGVTPGQQDTLYQLVLALARRVEDLTARVEALERPGLGARIRRAVGGKAA